MREFTLELVATPASIDELGHVNNAVWVQWIQQVATGHWDAAAPQSHKDTYIWVVVRHEIDYLRALALSSSAHTVRARTCTFPSAPVNSMKRSNFAPRGLSATHVRAVTASPGPSARR